jgi:superfamily I DNA and/or RNA helicase
MELKTLLQEFINSLNIEITAKQKKAKIRPIPIKDGIYFTDYPGGRIYKFNEIYFNLMSDSPAEVVIDEKKHNATVIGVDDEVLTLFISGENLPEEINKALLIIDDTKILQNVKDTINRILDDEERPPKNLANALFGIGQIYCKIIDYDDFPDNFNSSQCETVKKSLGSNALFIWGPPGTGKSATLSFIVEILSKKGLSILISAHTNEAVDNLMEKAMDSFSNQEIEDGVIIRWRMTRSEKLLPITPAYKILSKKEKINKEINKLRQAQEPLTIQKNKLENGQESSNNKDQNLNQKQINQLNEAIGNIGLKIDQLKEELDSLSGMEYEYLKNAQVVGTTLTSATINQQLRERSFDIVIVDEVSMAPCPSLYASCALANKKSILCGDFYQLSPIAASRDAEWLHKSIFDKLGITQKVSRGQTLNELTILDTQYRCHPKIANSIINTIYHGKLKNGYEESHPSFYAQNLEPYANDACILLDLSRISTNSNPWCEQRGTSWINTNSADLTVKLTNQGLAAGIKTIGIITPYSA